MAKRTNFDAIEPVGHSGDALGAELGTGGSEGGFSETFDPASLDAIGSGGNDQPRKRGRPKGSRNAAPGAPRQKETRVSVDAISSTLFSIHAMLATALKTPEFAVSPQEAEALAKAAAEVARHYPGVLDPKAIAWGNLAVTIGAVYGTRVVAYGMRQRSERAQRAKPAQTMAVQ